MARKTGGTFGKSDKLFLGLLVLVGLIAGGFWLWANKPVVVWVSFVALVLSIVGVATKAAYEWNQSRADRNLARDDKRAGTALKTSRLETQESAKRRAFVKEERERVALERERLRLEREKALDFDPELAPMSWADVFKLSRSIIVTAQMGAGKTASIPAMVRGHKKTHGKRARVQVVDIDAATDTDERQPEGVLNPVDLPLIGWGVDVEAVRAFILWWIEDVNRKLSGEIQDKTETLVVFDEFNSTKDEFEYNKLDPGLMLEFFKRSGSRIRKARYTVVIMAQADNVAALGIEGWSAMKHRFATIKINADHTATVTLGDDVHELLLDYQGRDVMRAAEREQWDLGRLRPRNIATDDELEHYAGKGERQAAGVLENTWTPPPPPESTSQRQRREAVQALVLDGETKVQNIAMAVYGKRTQYKKIREWAEMLGAKTDAGNVWFEDAEPVAVAAPEPTPAAPEKELAPAGIPQGDWDELVAFNKVSENGRR
ncbi:MAG: hypothetical protein ACYTEQ_28765 [Planctomycetota bacterium]|jgi:hypothetical protein